mgnify:CR=1 FL=1
MTQKQYDFCVHYIKNGFNSYQAALSAGYNKKHALAQSYQFCEKTAVKPFLRRSSLAAKRFL